MRSEALISIRGLNKRRGVYSLCYFQLTRDELSAWWPLLATGWPVPPGSRLFALLLLVRLLGGGDLLSAVQERAQCHPAEHVSMRLLYELHQLADVTVQTLGRKRVAKQVRQRERCVNDKVWSQEEKYKEYWPRVRLIWLPASNSVCLLMHICKIGRVCQDNSSSLWVGGLWSCAMIKPALLSVS